MIKITMKKRNKRMRMKGSQGVERESYMVSNGHFHNRTGVDGRGGASGGDRAGGVVGVVVSRVFRIFEEQSLRRDSHHC